MYFEELNKNVLYHKRTQTQLNLPELTYTKENKLKQTQTNLKGAKQIKKNLSLKNS